MLPVVNLIRYKRQAIIYWLAVVVVVPAAVPLVVTMRIS